MTDDPLDEPLRAARDEYHLPPPPPRDQMWTAIAARKKRGKRWPQPLGWGRLAWPVGIAALLALGFGLGRLTRDHRGSAAPTQAAGPSDRGASEETSAALAGATLQHLSRAETFLTGFRLEAGAREPDPTLLTGARDLLGTTRLLLDSPGLRDQRQRRLLEELEMVLAQVIQLQADPSRADADLIVRQLDEQGVLPRLRVSIPAGPTAVTHGES
jgi:hypothetical protein